MVGIRSLAGVQVAAASAACAKGEQQRRKVRVEIEKEVKVTTDSVHPARHPLPARVLLPSLVRGAIVADSSCAMLVITFFYVGLVSDRR